MLTCRGAPWPFAIAGRCLDALGHWVQYCCQALALSIAEWAEIACGLLMDHFRIVCGFLADYMRISCGLLADLRWIVLLVVFLYIHAIAGLKLLGFTFLARINAECQFGKIFPPFQQAKMWMAQYYRIISEVDVTVILALS